MHTSSHRELIPVLKGNLLSLGQDGPVEIECESGAVWITQDNDVRDVVLNAGEHFVSDRPGNVLVYALQQTVISATAPAIAYRPTFWQRVAALLRPRGRDRGFATA